jgi:hypothetical protein
MVRGRRMSNEEAIGIQCQAGFALLAVRSKCKVDEVLYMLTLRGVHGG